MKQTIDKQVFNKLTKLYLLALVAVAFISLLGQLIIQLFLTESLNDAHVVNIAGRQRMLSQKLSKTATLLCDTTIFTNHSINYKNELVKTIDLWAKSHNGLMNGQLQVDKNIKVKNSPKIDSLFLILDPIFKTIYFNSKLLVQDGNIKQSDGDTPLFKILSNEGKFLETMINIVSEYDLEAQERVNNTKKIELLLFVLLFTVLLLEGILIFKPIANNIRLVIKQLTDSESNLQIANEDLTLSNYALIEAKKELEIATEEKYKLQLAKEKIRSSSLIEGQELERKRLALELHDGIGQMLTGLRLQTEHLKSNTTQNEKTIKSVDNLQSLIVETIEATRSASFNLAPSVLSDFGLTAAIKLLIDKQKISSQIPIEFNSVFDKRITENIEIGLYRIVQEGINNALKHSEAKKISIQLYQRKQELVLIIADDGKGMETKKNAKKITIGGSGINNMQTRAELLDGEFLIESEKNKGTKITVIVPRIGI